MGEVVQGSFITSQKLNPDTVLENLKGQFDSFSYAGRLKDGTFTAGATINDVGELLVLLELSKQAIMDGVE